MAKIERSVEIVEHPLGDRKLFVSSFVGQEYLGRIFQFDLEILTEDCNFQLDSMLGKTLTVGVQLRMENSRFFNGFATEFCYVGKDEKKYHRYAVTLRPWMWFLTRTSNCKVFQNVSVPEILKAVFDTHGFGSLVDFQLTAEYQEREYCVQYDETDFNFVSRLMEEEGIYYYFTHQADKHLCVVVDSPTKHQSFPGFDEIPFYPPGNEEGRKRDHIHTWVFSKKIQPTRFALGDYDFMKPNVQLLASKKRSDREHSHADYEIYDYPGSFVTAKDGENYANIRMEEQQVKYETSHGSSNAIAIGPGYLFALTGYPLNEQNREYLTVGARYSITCNVIGAGANSGKHIFDCAFEAIPSKEVFRPGRSTARPIIPGSQTALVVGDLNEEIDTDEYGRIKIQFYWDRYGKKDKDSSCYVRVASFWAGKQWGAIHIPRIGQEVVVSFLEGNPDKPLVTGSVYNQANMPPYALPQNKTQSGIKSRSTKEGTAENFNEMRFEDKKGVEQLYLHAERNMDRVIENDETQTVGHDETNSVGNDRKESVGNNEEVSIGVNRTHDIGKDEMVTIGNDRTEDVGKNENVSVGNNRVHAIGKNDSLDVGKNYFVNAGDQIILQTGAASIVMKKNGDIVISGKNISIEGSGKIDVIASKEIIMKGSKIAQN